jgi:hypothetical protein
MRRPGLNREEMTFLNRVTHEYKQDALPNPEQIRFDVNRLVRLLICVNDQLEKVRREA